MSEQVFVDTSAWFALADTTDRHHDQAAAILRRMVSSRVLLVTTNHIAGETYTLLRTRLGAPQAQSYLFRIRSSPSIQRVFVSELWEEAAEAILLQYSDQAFSFVDAVSFVTMRHLGLVQAFAFDYHFEVAGFVSPSR